MKSTIAVLAVSLAFLATNPKIAQAAGNSAASSASGLSNAIETVGFDTRTRVGYGGMLTFDPTPIVLFKSGDALRDMAALKSITDVATHKAAHPKSWTTWRRSGKAIEILQAKGWQKITYTQTLDRLPAGYQLVGAYRRLSGGGNLAIGGNAAIAVWSTLSFDRAGNFASGGGSGSSTSNESAGTTTSVVTTGRAPDRYGRYRIEGYTLTLNYADGRVERRMIVTDVSDPGVIWLDGDGYTSR
ncbi:MAG: hypothetical protein KDI32_08295 [Pseudomonadales bacterium]|nr:hypothetical protein [Pseudomonadales bacterium]